MYGSYWTGYNWNIQDTSAEGIYDASYSIGFEVIIPKLHSLTITVRQVMWS